MAKAKAKLGRPTKLTAAVVGNLIEGFKNDFTVEEACRFAGIHKDTYYEERKRNPAFADEMDRAQDYPLILAKKTLFRALKWDSELSLKVLERRQRDRYASKQITEHQGSVAVTYDDLANTKPKANSPDEARKMAQKTK